jgi:hypothetical protein
MRTHVDGAAALGTHIELDTSGAVSDTERDRAEASISAVLTRRRGVADGARVRLSGSYCAGGPGLVQVNLRVCAAPARIQVAGPTMTIAIAAAASRLERQIDRLSTAWRPWPWPDPERRTLGLPGDAPVKRRKSVRLYVGTACHAAAYMDAMDFDVYLYTDAETGEDAIVYRAGPTGLALARQRTMRPPVLPGQLALTVNPRKTPVLTGGRAAARLAEGWLPFLFYTDHDTGRGNLVYRRYDGNLGLIAPAASDPGRPAPVTPTLLSIKSAGV